MCNVDEEGLEADNDHVKTVKEHARSLGSEVIVVCAQAEAELSELEEEERRSNSGICGTWPDCT